MDAEHAALDLRAVARLPGGMDEPLSTSGHAARGVEAEALHARHRAAAEETAREILHLELGRLEPLRADEEIGPDQHALGPAAVSRQRHDPRRRAVVAQHAAGESVLEARGVPRLRVEAERA